MEIYEWKEKYNAKCKELNAVKEKLASRDQWIEAKVS
jgi:hypothetical protein